MSMAKPAPQWGHSVLRFDKGRLMAASCAFWGGETRDIPSKRYEFPIGGFFRLHKDVENRLVPMSKSRAAFEIACNVPGVERTLEEHGAVLDLATRAAAQSLTYDLHFSKNDSSFWRAIDDLG